MKYSLGFIDTKKIGVVIFMAMMLTAMITKPADANGGYQLDVTYTSGSIIYGPLSFGLSTLPTSVTATYTLGPGGPNPDPDPDDVVLEDEIYFDESDVISASISFGDATWTSSDLVSFSMLTTENRVHSLTYNFSPITTPLTFGVIILNFPLTITGTDIASGQPFEYKYAESTQTLTPIVQTLTVAIDIKPGNDPNCFNANGHGVIPVAILGSEGFDVSSIDLNTLSFGGLAVRVRGNKGPLCSIDYSNGDAYLDLVCHFEDDASAWEPGVGDAVLTGNLIDGTSFEGTDSICVVP